MTLKGGSLHLPNGQLRLPTFMPDATFGVVRALDSNDLIRCGVQAVVMNTFHLMQHPGSSVIELLGGLHKLFGWNHPIITDSGGFQVYSLIRQNSKYGSITKKGITFYPRGPARKFILTPEKSIRLQMDYGSDLLICLDDCTHVDESFQRQKESVNRTIDWAKRCKVEFEHQIAHRHSSDEPKPLLFGVIQGGRSHTLRRQCAKELLEMGFDGFGYGGYPLDRDGKLLTDVVKFTRELIPDNFPVFALGIGSPKNLVKCARLGYDLFDSSLPTRDARRGRLYVFKTDEPCDEYPERDWYSCLYIQDKKHIKNKGPISPYCDCLTCSNYSVAYLHHLFKINDHLYFRLATIHNLRFMMLLMKRLRGNAEKN